MHEHAIAEKIIKEANSQGNVKKIVVECGALAHIPAKDIENILKDHANFKVEVLETPAEVECDCGFKGEPNIEMHSHDVSVFFCPKCNKVPKIIKGEDIILKSVELY